MAAPLSPLQPDGAVEEALDRLSLNDTNDAAKLDRPRGVIAVAGLQDVVESLRELIGMWRVRCFAAKPSITSTCLCVCNTIRYPIS